MRHRMGIQCFTLLTLLHVLLIALPAFASTVTVNTAVQEGNTNGYVLIGENNTGGLPCCGTGCPSGQQCSVQLQYVPATWDSCLGANLVAVQGAPADSNAAFNCNMCLPPGILVWGLTYGPVCPQALVATMPTVITTSKLVGQAVRHKMHVDIAISLLLLAGP